MKRILTTLTVIAPAALLAACGYVSEYEKGVYDYEPVYCYQSLAGIQCFEEPNHRDEKRLVNYYGPAPSRRRRPPTMRRRPSISTCATANPFPSRRRLAKDRACPG